MSSQLVQEFYLALSQERLEAYRPENGTDLEMLTNCFWNIDLVEALVPCLHATELALRNGIHRELTNRYQDEMWFYRPGGLDSRGLRELATALQKAAHKPPLLPGKLVAALTFGFWVMLLDSRYEQVLWQPNRFALQHAVFPNAQSPSRKDTLVFRLG